jgi:SPP1 gp7 family putative phage head morphogenesis protein
MNSSSAYLIDVFVRHQTYLEGLKASIAADADPLIRELQQALTSALAASGVTTVDELTPAQLEELVLQVTRTEQALFGDYAKKLDEQLQSVATYEAEFAAAAVQGILAEGTMEAASAATAWLYARTHPVQATGQLLEKFIADWTARDVAAVEAVLRNAHAQGWTMMQAITAIRGTRARNYKDGVVNKIGADIGTLVRTSIQHVSNTARMATYEANPDIVIGYRWVSTLDSKTTPVCRSLDGNVYQMGAGPMPPLHPNCRSVTVPELNETAKILELITRASSTGPVTASTTYYDWLKSQPASFQDSVLGPTRGKLLRNGGLTSDEFARLNLGRTFKPRTLEEMRSLWPEVFNKAGI